MARIRPVYEGMEITRVAPWATITLEEAIALFGLKRTNLIGEFGRPVSIGTAGALTEYAGYKHVVVELDKAEAKRLQWKAGFYWTKVKPADAFKLLLKQAAAKELGAKNVLRVLSEPTLDSNGNEAVRVTVVVANNTMGNVANNAVLNALVGLRERLREMNDDRTPIIEYATEKELKASVGR